MARPVGLDRDRVVAVAAAVADADGLGAVTLARVAAELVVQAPSLYAHVDGLPGLRAALARRGASALARDLATASAGRPGRDALRAMAHAYRRFAHAHPGLLAAANADAPTADADPVQAAALAEPVTVVVDALGADPDDAAAIHAVRALRAALHGFCDLEARGGFGLPVDLDASYDRLVDVVVTALTTPRATAGASALR